MPIATSASGQYRQTMNQASKPIPTLRLSSVHATPSAMTPTPTIRRVTLRRPRIPSDMIESFVPMASACLSDSQPRGQLRGGSRQKPRQRDGHVPAVLIGQRASHFERSGQDQPDERAGQDARRRRQHSGGTQAPADDSAAAGGPCPSRSVRCASRSSRPRSQPHLHDTEARGRAPALLGERRFGPGEWRSAPVRAPGRPGSAGYSISRNGRVFATPL